MGYLGHAIDPDRGIYVMKYILSISLTKTLLHKMTQKRWNLKKKTDHDDIQSECTYFILKGSFRNERLNIF